VLPYYPELKLQEHYGVNSLDKMIYKYGVSFKVGKCCHSTYICSEIYVAPNSKSNICYCAPHYVEEIKKQSLDEKQALLKKKEDAIKKKKEDVVKKKEENAKKKEDAIKKKEEIAKKKEENAKKKEENAKKKEDAIKKKEELLKKKENETTNKLKLLEEMNIARTSIGLKALKCLPRIKIKKVITNV
jgi:flagellar biosynthesis GTPase FlhF